MIRNIASWVVPIVLLAGAGGWLYAEANAEPGEWDRYGAVSEREPLGKMAWRQGPEAGPYIAAFSRGSQWLIHDPGTTVSGAAFEMVRRPLITLVCVKASDTCWRAAPLEVGEGWLASDPTVKLP